MKLPQYLSSRGLLLWLCLFVSVSVYAQRPLGIDVYSGSGTITWSTVKSSGYTFAWTKATEGTYYIDADLASNEGNAKAAGVYIGSYHFARPDQDSPATEATYYWNQAASYVANDGKSLMPMLDYETFNGYVGASNYGDWANQYCHDVQTNAAARGVTVTPVIYISACNACDLNGADDSGWGAWIADYNGEAASTGTPWSTCTGCEIWGSGVWNLWQYSSSTVVPGVPGNGSGYCDVDVFNGTASSFVSKFLIGGVSVSSAPTNVTVAVGGSATFKVTASGTGTLTYQWLFNNTNISKATAATYTITNAQLTNIGSYAVAISNSLGTVISSPAYLWVLAPMTNPPGAALAPANMVSWWPGDSNSIDIYGYNNAIPTGAMYYTNGEVGMSFHFDGSSSYLTPTATSELSPNWTLCLWVNRQNAPTASASVMGDSTYAIKLEQYNATREIGITHSGVADYVFHCSLPQNTWTHLALVNSGSTIELYSNAVAVTSTLYSNGVPIVTPSGIPLPRGCIGADLLSNGNPIDYMLGRLDEIQIFNRALSATEIAAIYHAGSAGLIKAPNVTGATSTNGQVKLQLVGLTGKNINILTSTDLVTWASLGSVANSSGSTTYSGTATNSQQFYRVSQ